MTYFWTFSACSDFSSDDFCAFSFWSADPGCSGTQQTSHFLLKNLTEIFFHHHESLASWMMLHLLWERKPEDVKESHPIVIDACFMYGLQRCLIWGFCEVRRILVWLPKDLFSNHILFCWLYWSEPAKWLLSQGQEKAQGIIMFPLWTVLTLEKTFMFLWKPTNQKRFVFL